MVTIYIYNLDHFILNMHLTVDMTTSKFSMEIQHGAPGLQKHAVSGNRRHVRSIAAEGFSL